jgi:predicted small lipoprotein YifL
VTRSTRPARAPSRNSWALIVLTASALALGACGRKGGLDLPPQAAGTPMGTAAPANDPDMNSAANKGSALTSSNQPDDVQAARGRKRSFFLDPILD